jgi:acyl-CoA thioester hydrolase
MKLELPSDNKKLVHAMTIPIRWGDMDAMGHVNNTVYFRYLESARIDWLRSINGAPIRPAKVR